MIDPTLVTATLDLPGFRVTRSPGLVRGVIVRSRLIVGSLGTAVMVMAEDPA